MMKKIGKIEEGGDGSVDNESIVGINQNVFKDEKINT